MGSTAKTFINRSLALALFLSLGYLAMPVSPAAQMSPEAMILEQELRESTRALQQLQRDAARTQEQVKLQQRLAGQFAILQIQAKEQHARIEQWNKVHAGESKITAKAGVKKKRYHCWFCL